MNDLVTAHSARHRHTETGFSMIELLVSMSIMLTVTGAIFSLVNPAQGAFSVQPEVADIQQRLRISSALLSQDLTAAGAGMDVAADVTEGGGPLIQFFPPVVPNRTGRIETDTTAPTDAVSLVRISNTPSQTTILDAISASPERVRVDASRSGCPSGDPRCGFDVGHTVVVFDATGAADLFFVVAATGSRITLEARGGSIAAPYSAGAFIARAETDTYYVDDQTNQLMHYDGWDTTTPLIDNVAALEFTYFGDAPPSPPSPGPPCGVNADRRGSGALVQLQPRDLANLDCIGRFDRDLYRVRVVKVDLRLQAGSVALRGTRVPDHSVNLEISPRNMNLTR